MEELVDLVVAQPGISDYNYMNNGIWNPEITTRVCVDSTTAPNCRVCYANIRTLARFFPSENPRDLTISGSVYIIRDWRRIIRNIHSAIPAPDNNNKKDGIDASGRHIQEGEDGSGEFELTVGLASANNSTASGGTIDRLVTCLMTMVLASAGASFMV